MSASLPGTFAQWFASRGWQPHAHQLAMLEAAQSGADTLLIAPTGGGKTLAGFLPSLVDLANDPAERLHTLYVSPLKALTVDVHRNLEQPVAEMGLSIRAETRTGDGGAVYSRGPTRFINCLFSGNSAIDVAGAIRQQGDSIFISACTFANNSANQTGAVHTLAGARVQVSNSVFWNNTDAGGTDEEIGVVFV